MSKKLPLHDRLYHYAVEYIFYTEQELKKKTILEGVGFFDIWFTGQLIDKNSGAWA